MAKTFQYHGSHLSGCNIWEWHCHADGWQPHTNLSIKQFLSVCPFKCLTVQYEVHKQHTFCITEYSCHQFLCRLLFLFFGGGGRFQVMKSILALFRSSSDPLTEIYMRNRFYTDDTIVAEVCTSFFSAVINVLRHWWNNCINLWWPLHETVVTANIITVFSCYSNKQVEEINVCSLLFRYSSYWKKKKMFI